MDDSLLLEIVISGFPSKQVTCLYKIKKLTSNPFFSKVFLFSDLTSYFSVDEVTSTALSILH